MAGRFKRIRPTSFMAMAAQMWPKPDQPIMYGSVELEMTRALDYIKRYSEKHGVPVTITHLVIAILARYLKKYPEANVKCEAGKFYQRQDIDIFVLVSVPGKKEDLAGVMLRNCDEMSLADIAARLGSKATEVKHGKDDKVVVRPIMKIMVTLDHRVMDGYKGGQLSAELKRIQDPEEAFGLAEKIPVGQGTEAEKPVEPVSDTKLQVY